MNRPIMMFEQPLSLDVPSSHLVEKVALCLPCGVSLSGNSCETSSLCSLDGLDSDIDTSFSSRSSSSPMAKALGQIETITLSASAAHRQPYSPPMAVATPARGNKRRGKKGRKPRQPRPQLSPEEMAKMPCRFFHSKKGCQRADCPYNHCLPAL